MGSLTWCTTRFALNLMGGENYWFLSLIGDKSMQVGGSARLHVLSLIWGNILCRLIVSVLRMSNCELAWVKILLLKWWLVLMKLVKKMQVHSICDHFLTLETWLAFDIF
jgi:hypothetical protein